MTRSTRHRARDKKTASGPSRHLGFLPRPQRTGVRGWGCQPSSVIAGGNTYYLPALELKGLRVSLVRCLGTENRSSPCR